MQKGDYLVLQQQTQLLSFPSNDKTYVQLKQAYISILTTAKTDGISKVFLIEPWAFVNGDTDNAAAVPNDTFQAMQARIQQGINDYAQTAHQMGFNVQVVPIGQAFAFINAENPSYYTSRISPSRNLKYINGSNLADRMTAYYLTGAKQSNGGLFTSGDQVYMATGNASQPEDYGLISSDDARILNSAFSSAQAQYPVK